MVLKKVYEGDVGYLQVMDENGNVDESFFPKELTDEKLVEMLKLMILTRNVDAKVLSLQRQGRAATYAPSLGEEATHIGAAMAMGDKDWFVPAFRQHGVFIARGLPLYLFFLYWKGFEEGNMIPNEVKALPVAVPVATQMLHAVGLAFAQKYKKTGGAVLGFVGDGGTSEGDFYEAINFSGVMKAPFIGIIENNEWAISIPRSKQTAAQTLAQKGLAAGITCLQVDGNDVIAVYKAVKDAIANIESGPTLIEALTFRMSMHTTADDPTKYRSDELVKEWQLKDPLLRLRTYLTKKGKWSIDIEAAINTAQKEDIDQAVAKAEQFKPDPKSMYTNIYSFMPDSLKNEMDAAIAANFWQGEVVK